jgi:hypothetical protein
MVLCFLVNDSQFSGHPLSWRSKRSAQSASDDLQPENKRMNLATESGGTESLSDSHQVKKDDLVIIAVGYCVHRSSLKMISHCELLSYGFHL